MTSDDSIEGKPANTYAVVPLNKLDIATLEDGSQCPVVIGLPGLTSGEQKHDTRLSVAWLGNVPQFLIDLDIHDGPSFRLRFGPKAAWWVQSIKDCQQFGAVVGDANVISTVVPFKTPSDTKYVTTNFLLAVDRFLGKQ